MQVVKETWEQGLREFNELTCDQNGKTFRCWIYIRLIRDSIRLESDAAGVVGVVIVIFNFSFSWWCSLIRDTGYSVVAVKSNIEWRNF